MEEQWNFLAFPVAAGSIGCDGQGWQQGTSMEDSRGPWGCGPGWKHADAEGWASSASPKVEWGSQMMFCSCWLLSLELGRGTSRAPAGR